MLTVRKQHYQHIQSIIDGLENSVLVEPKLKVMHTNALGLWYTGRNEHTHRQGHTVRTKRQAG